MKRDFLSPVCDGKETGAFRQMVRGIKKKLKRR
jgi:hypothetical protein